MVIPHRELSQEALQGLLEEYVTRDGTDYGESEVPLQQKVEQVRSQLDKGLCFIIYDGEFQSISVVPKDKIPEGCRMDG